MPKFRKKPVEIEARQWDGSASGAQALVDWMGGVDHGLAVNPPAPKDAELWIHTKEGNLRASPRDWIIRGVQGEHYPCKPDIFAATYDAVIERLESPTIEQLEKILTEPTTKVQIHPDGSVTTEQR